MPTDREALGRALRNARENRDLSQQDAAEHLGLSRSLVAQIELGNRAVSDDELAKFARLYRTSVVDLTGTRVAKDDPLTVALFDVAPELLKVEEVQRQFHGALGPLLEIGHLERLLERPSLDSSPLYDVPSPANPTEAVVQGEHIAGQERLRLGIGAGPIEHLSALISSQGIRVTSMDLPDDISGLFLQHPSIGSAIVANSRHDAARRRLFEAHSYAHSLFERRGTTRVCRRSNSAELVERRASAFAAALLLPASGIEDVLTVIGKGSPSRRTYWVFDGSAEAPVRAQQRSTPGSQTLTYADVVLIARRFGVVYRVAVTRLLGIGVISELEGKALLARKQTEIAGRYEALLTRQFGASPISEASELSVQHIHLAIEAYRRRLISKQDLVMDATVLQIPELTPAALLEFAKAAR